LRLHLSVLGLVGDVLHFVGTPLADFAMEAPEMPLSLMKIVGVLFNCPMAF